MDLNYLLQRHQISLMRAEHAASSGARYAHAGLAAAYADLIDQAQDDLGAGRTLRRNAS